LLGLMDLKEAGTTLVADYSHGMRKKLSLAAALLPGPKLLFLDEPFEGIDAVASRQIKELLLSFVGRGGTIFLTSHILEIVERLSTHIGVIAKGRMVAQGSIDELRAGGAAGQTLEELFITLVGGESKAQTALDWI
jgi:ABC-2 type transport system ATP-binding protein